MPHDAQALLGHRRFVAQGVNALLPTRGDGLLTTAEAAALVGVAPATIRGWARRSAKRQRLAPAGLDERGFPLYTRRSVIAAEKQVMLNGLRASGVNPRTLRLRANRAA